MIRIRIMTAAGYTRILFFLIGILTSPAAAQTTRIREGDVQGKKSIDSWPWREFIEPNFPFFSTTLDVRSSGEQATEKDVVPRALIFPLAGDCFLAYDVDLLRVVAVWTADELPLVNANLAVNSYPYKLNKVPAGTKALPRPNGEIWFRNGSYAGVGAGEPRIVDPRPDLPEAEQILRGGLEPSLARFLGVDLNRNAEIELEIAGVRVRERFTHGSDGLQRHLQVNPHRKPIFLVLAKVAKDRQSSNPPKQLD